MRKLLRANVLNFLLDFLSDLCQMQRFCCGKNLPIFPDCPTPRTMTDGVKCILKINLQFDPSFPSSDQVNETVCRALVPIFWWYFLYCTSCVVSWSCLTGFSRQSSLPRASYWTELWSKIVSENQIPEKMLEEIKFCKENPRIISLGINFIVPRLVFADFCDISQEITVLSLSAHNPEPADISLNWLRKPVNC